MKLSVIVPAYNESKTISEILLRLSKVSEVSEIIVVDDGSKDDTFEKVKTFSEEIKKSRAALSVICLRHETNRGKGAAIRTGLLRVTGDVMTIQDGDLEYDPNDYKKMLKKIEEGSTVVYGSRILGSNKFSYAGFYWGGRLLSFLSNILYGLSITDEPTCYKMARMDVMRRLDLRCEKFEFCPEMTAKVARLKEKIIEVPISYNPRSIEEGKKIRWSDGIEAVWTLMKFRFWNPTK